MATVVLSICSSCSNPVYVQPSYRCWVCNAEVSVTVGVLSSLRGRSAWSRRDCVTVARRNGHAEVAELVRSADVVPPGSPTAPEPLCEVCHFMLYVTGWSNRCYVCCQPAGAAGRQQAAEWGRVKWTWEGFVKRAELNGHADVVDEAEARSSRRTATVP